ncbi:HelD family protein [Haloimpatiens sp. FM7330]|uniref:HelD family protein n=1 Tax=Haloimpatiens sp. FM7330 TaxID=3298610 RepID=UPI00363DEBE2
MDKNSNKNVNQEFEFELEKEHLFQVIKRIKDEILNYINKRNSIKENLLQYRKKVLEEYKDDEDKIIEYFDHERFIKEEAYKTIDRRLREMTILQNAPYFGSVEFEEEEFDDREKIHIGRFGLTPEGEYEPLVIDWRAPVASLFYAGKLGRVEYNAPLGKVETDILNKRQYIVKNEKLLGMFDSVLDVKDEVLQAVLSKNAEEKLKDIVMTIQKEQDDIIRQPKDKTVIVDGVAGSGKTTIALHRVAYLLYNYRKSLQDKVLIFGPNSIFMEYISLVLPSLGETGVKQTTFNDFALGILNIKDIMSLTEYMEKIISNDEDFIKDILLKTSKEYKKNLDEKISKLNNEYFKIQDVIFDGRVVISSKQIEDMFNEYYKYMPLFRRSKKIKRIIFSKLKDSRDEKVREIQKEYNEKISKLNKEQLELDESFLDLQRRIKIRNIVKEVIIVKKNLHWLDNPDCLEIYNEINGWKQLTYDDLAPILYLKIKLENLKIRNEIKHVVIDEAQDYGYLQFIVIKELTKCNSMTIVGDRNQRLIPINSNNIMNNLNYILEDLDTEYFKLTKSYRSTRQIMEYANKYLQETSIVPLVRDGKEVKKIVCSSDIELSEEILDNVEQLQKSEYESIAIICKDLSKVNEISSLIKNKLYINMLDREEKLYKGGVVLLPSYFAKGLEFDSVILIEDEYNELEDNLELSSNKLKYVMATRALHELIIIKKQY